MQFGNLTAAASPSRKVLSLNGSNMAAEQNRSRCLYDSIRHASLLVFLIIVVKVVLLDLSDPAGQQMERWTDVVGAEEASRSDVVAEASRSDVVAEAGGTRGGASITNENVTKTHRPSLHLVGERHSGTKWITQHLIDCFSPEVSVRSGLTRWKHWFQENGDYSHYQRGDPGDERKTVVVAQFRGAYRWVEAMRAYPHHSQNHFDLDWQDFVTRSWTMPRRGKDVAFGDLAGGPMTVPGTEQLCQVHFRPTDVIPCLEHEPYVLTLPTGKGREIHSLYELRNDGSGQPYDSILELRADKIKNFLSIADFDGIQDFFPIQYEHMVANGTATLIRNLEQALGVKAQCPPIDPQSVPSRPFAPEYVEWMKEHVDWETEALIGYDESTF
jgi:hypothetical protein